MLFDMTNWHIMSSSWPQLFIVDTLYNKILFIALLISNMIRVIIKLDDLMWIKFFCISI